MTIKRFLDYLCVGGAVLFVVVLLTFFLYGNYLMLVLQPSTVTGGQVFTIIMTCVIWGVGLMAGITGIIVNFESSYKRLKEYHIRKKFEQKIFEEEYGPGKKSSHAPTTF